MNVRTTQDLMFSKEDIGDLTEGRRSIEEVLGDLVGAEEDFQEAIARAAAPHMSKFQFQRRTAKEHVARLLVLVNNSDELLTITELARASGLAQLRVRYLVNTYSIPAKIRKINSRQPYATDKAKRDAALLRQAGAGSHEPLTVAALARKTGLREARIRGLAKVYDFPVDIRTRGVPVPQSNGAMDIDSDRVLVGVVEGYAKRKSMVRVRDAMKWPEGTLRRFQDRGFVKIRTDAKRNGEAYVEPTMVAFKYVSKLPEERKGFAKKS